MGAVAGMAPASFAENAGVHTDAEVQAMVAEELRLSREVGHRGAHAAQLQTVHPAQNLLLHGIQVAVGRAHLVDDAVCLVLDVL